MSGFRAFWGLGFRVYIGQFRVSGLRVWASLGFRFRV